jgi:hypothetical protein
VPQPFDQNQPMTSEAKLTLGASGAGLLTLLLDLVKDSPTSKISDPVMIALLCCVTAIIISYNISRGMAKYEYRGLPPGTLPEGMQQQVAVGTRYSTTTTTTNDGQHPINTLMQG